MRNKFHTLWAIVGLITGVCIGFLGQGHLLEGPYVPAGGNLWVQPAPAAPDSTGREAPKVITYKDHLEHCLHCEPIGLTSPYTSSPLVKEYQKLLNTIGFEVGVPDGIFGPATAAAVKRFQKANNLPLTGILDATSINALVKAYEETLPATELPSPPEKVSLYVDIEERVLLVLCDGKPYAQFPVAVGKDETPTPFGTYFISEKKEWSGGFGTRWLGLSVPWGVYGIHGTNKPWTIGKQASKGCIRMYNKDVEKVFEWVPIGTEVVISGGPSKRLLFQDDKGPDVLLIQQRLKELGFFSGELDGYLGSATRKAIIEFQNCRGLDPDGNVGPATYEALGI